MVVGRPFLIYVNERPYWCYTLTVGGRTTTIRYPA